MSKMDHHEGEQAEAQSIVEDPICDEKPAAPPSRFKVLAEKCISWMGCMTWLHKDDVIEAAGYGTDGIEKLIEQGVKLQPVE